MKNTTYTMLTSLAESFFYESWGEEYVKKTVCSTMEKIGVDTCDTKHSIQIAPNWTLDLNCSSLMPAKMVKKNIVEFMENLFNSVPNEYQFCNLTAENAIELGFHYDEKGDFYRVPLWYWSLVPVGTKLYGRYLTDKISESIKTGNEDTDNRCGYIYWGVRL